MYGGEENVPENPLSRKLLDPSKRASGLLSRGFLYRKNRALTLEGGGKRTVRGGVQNPFLGGVSFLRFSTPLFFPPPHWRPLKKGLSHLKLPNEPIGLDELKGAPFTYFYLSSRDSTQTLNAEEEGEDDDDAVILMEEASPPTNTAKD